jgi:hypothetical protein
MRQEDRRAKNTTRDTGVANSTSTSNGGRLAGVVKFISNDPQSTAWAKGSEGERRLAAHLVRSVGDRAVLLHDHKVPGTRGNIDHLVVASSGVWVIEPSTTQAR